MDSLMDLWREITPELHNSLGDIAYDVWINSITPVKMTASELLLKVPGKMHKDIVSQRFSDDIRKCVKDKTGLDIPIRIVTEDEAGGFFDINSPDPLEIPEKTYEYTFKSFVVGPSNCFAHAAATAVANKPAQDNYNPLFIYGASGLGKTHLLLAIRDYVLKGDPDLKVVYIKGDQFTNELIEAISKGLMMNFRKRYRYADIFLMDDVQFIGGKNSTQEELFHTFNELYQARKQIVLTSDRPPKEIATLEERLRSRFESGIIADIQPPEYETRVAIIRQLCAFYKLSLPDNVTENIAQNVKSNIRQIEGVIKKINVTCQLEHEKPSINIAQNAIRDIKDANTPLPHMVQRIVDEVARSFEVSSADIYSKKRTQPLSLARQVAMYCVREITGLPYDNIGEQFNNRDHTTVIYAVQVVTSRMKDRPDFRATVQDIIKNIQA